MLVWCKIFWIWSQKLFTFFSSSIQPQHTVQEIFCKNCKITFHPCLLPFLPNPVHCCSGYGLPTLKIPTLASEGSCWCWSNLRMLLSLKWNSISCFQEDLDRSMFSSKEKVSVHCTVLYNIYAEVSSSVIWEEKKEKKSLRRLKYGFVKKLLHYECTSCQLTISSHQNMEGYLLTAPT